MIGFISGCWDGPDGAHQGHSFILSEARKFVDKLIVAVNSDDYIERNKKRKPFLTAQKRAEKLLTIGADEAIVFTGDSPLHLILKYKPNYIFVGDDYCVESVVGYKECQEWGGKIKIIKRIPNISTTILHEQRKRIEEASMPGKA